MFRIYIVFETIFIAVMLLACGTHIKPKDNLKAHETLFIGRFAASFLHEGKTKSLQGKFSYFQQSNLISLELFSIFGQTQLKLDFYSNKTFLYLPGQAPQLIKYNEKNDLASTKEFLGFELPIKSLGCWLQPEICLVTAENKLEISKDKNGRVNLIKQVNWLISYPNANRQDDKLRIIISNEAQALKLNLLIDIRKVLH